MRPTEPIAVHTSGFAPAVWCTVALQRVAISSLRSEKGSLPPEEDVRPTFGSFTRLAAVGNF